MRIIWPKLLQNKSHHLEGAKKANILPEPQGPIGWHWSPLVRHQPRLQVHGHWDSASHKVPVQLPALPIPIYTAWWQRQQGVRNLPKIFAQQWPGQELNTHLRNASLMPYKLCHLCRLTCLKSEFSSGECMTVMRPLYCSYILNIPNMWLSCPGDHYSSNFVY